MTTRRGHISRALLVCVLVGIAILGARSAAAQTPGPGSDCYWGRINDAGRAVGMCYGEFGPQALLWKDGVTTVLSSPERPISWALDINARGQVVGTSWDFDWTGRPFLWQKGVMTYLDTLGGAEGQALAINDRGEVVGTSTDAEGGRHNTLWRNGRPLDLASLGCPVSPADINNRSEIVGTDSAGHMILCRNGRWQDLTPGAAGWFLPMAINDLSQVVGYVANSDGSESPFLWDKGVLTDLGSFGGYQGRAGDINNRGQIVGFSQDPSGQPRAFLWQNGVMTDLTPAGSAGSIAWGINNVGQIVGNVEGGLYIWPR